MRRTGPHLHNSMSICVALMCEVLVQLAEQPFRSVKLLLCRINFILCKLKVRSVNLNLEYSVILADVLKFLQLGGKTWVNFTPCFVE